MDTTAVTRRNKSPYLGFSAQTAAPELMMEGRGFAERPTETPPAGPGPGPGSVVPSPLQSSCRACSRPGMEMDLAVLGGLRGGGQRKRTRLYRAARPALLQMYQLRQNLVAAATTQAASLSGYNVGAESRSRFKTGVS